MRRIPPAWRLAFFLWLAMRLVTWAFGAALFASGFAPLESGYSFGIDTLTEGFSGALWGIWMRWDGVYYDLILTQGYHALPNLSAFFPLYPLLAHPLTALGMHPIPALIIISNLALLPALGLFLEEVERLLGAGYRLPAGLALMLFPTAFFFYAPYPQSLAFLLILLAWRFARTQRWLACALAGLLAGLAHSTVIPLAALLLVEVITWLRASSGKLRWAALAVPFMPLAGVAFFMGWQISVGLAPMAEVMSNFWGRHMIWPWQIVTEWLDLVLKGNYLIGFSSLMVMILSLAALAWAFRKLPLALVVYQLGLILFTFSTTASSMPLASYIRYALLGFPMFLALGYWMRRKPKLKLGMLAGFGVLYCILCALYLSWVWVA